MSVEMSFKKLMGIAGVAAGLSMFAVTGANAAPDPNFHIYIAYGQSNMEGNARNFTDVDKKEHPRVKMFATTSCPSLGRPTVGEMYPAVPPMFKCGEGLSVADWFGRHMADSLPDVTIGIIPVAQGGNGIYDLRDICSKQFLNLRQRNIAVFNNVMEQGCHNDITFKPPLCDKLCDPEGVTDIRFSGSAKHSGMLCFSILIGFFDLLLTAYLVVLTVDVHDIVEINFHLVCHKITSFPAFPLLCSSLCSVHPSAQLYAYLEPLMDAALMAWYHSSSSLSEIFPYRNMFLSKLFLI